ncbi:DUF2147 domain-containing protein [Oceanivirga miroungae]|uniref:DUF2147 domain-containing protein n=1 Tax=Oceanivirga miroungae TaxID=1130046 RepID=A0A6I8M5Y2_9FUSO|nr:DUF2147 domain-containing protein [Oceanivirga miroungae]VWL84812.1 hypothetical protein OMES3154_00065 [Oceanivirga miroungae]
MRKILLISILMSFFSFSSDIVGKWYNAVDKNDYDAILEIKKDENEKYSVYIIEMKNPTYEEGENKGKDKMDLYNEDKSLRTRKLVGLKIVDDLYYNKDRDYYDKGNIYNPKDGKTYYVYMWLENENILSVKGYIDPLGWFGKTTKWSRFDEIK